MRGKELSHFDFFFRLCIFVVRRVIFLLKVVQTTYTGVTVENHFCRYLCFAGVDAKQDFLIYFCPAVLRYLLGDCLVHH